MRIVPAQRIKRRGMAAVDEALAEGPVHIIRNNRPQYVLMTEERYQELLEAHGYDLIDHRIVCSTIAHRLQYRWGSRTSSCRG